MAGLTTVLRLLRLGGSKLLFGLIWMFKGGSWSYVGITVFVVYANLEAFMTFNPITIVTSVGHNLVAFDMVIKESASAIVGGQLSGFDYLSTFVKGVLGPFLHILWYVRGFHKVLEGLFNENLMYTATLPLSTAFLGMAMLAVRPELPFEGVRYTIRNLGEIVQVQDIPFVDVTNGTAPGP